MEGKRRGGDRLGREWERREEEKSIGEGREDRSEEKEGIEDRSEEKEGRV